MKFANLSIKGQPTVSLVNSETGSYWPVSELIPGFAGDMIQLVQQYANIKGQLTPKGPGAPLAGAKILAPITQPLRNIFCVGKNYHEHAAEFAKSGFDSSAKEGEHAPEAPVIFTKPVSTIIGPGDKIPPHVEVTQQLDYEAELTVIIGKGGRGIKKADAFGHVFGYTIVNDVTARDLQKLHRQWFLGKALDGFCPMGPYIVTSDEIAGNDLTIQCWVNGELRQDSHTSLLIFDIPTLIETISAGITLQAGDIIATGTPAGVGIGATPPKFLKAGDVVKMAVQGIGTLENTVG